MVKRATTKPRVNDGLLTKVLGKTGRAVTTFGLGGQASIQWPRPGVDGEKIILKAVGKGVTYFDTSNIYGPSQLTFGKAFRRLHLIPGRPGYDQRLRKNIFLASKTHMRYSVVSNGELGPNSVSNGESVQTAIDDVKRSLSQIFGDGRGAYPKGAYLDLVQIHNLNTLNEIDAIYEGLENPDPGADHIGAFAGLVDLRDGTNRTGANPREEKLIHHIGITGHWNSPAYIDAIQRDHLGVIETLLIAINSNDKRYLNHQNNVIPVAKAKGIGVIGMKIFSDAVYYGRESGSRSFSHQPEDVYMRVGSKELPSGPLIQYALSVPGVDFVIIGIGQIDDSDDPAEDQLVANLNAAQLPEPLPSEELRRIEARSLEITGGDTNYFQRPAIGLTPPRGLRAECDSGYYEYKIGIPNISLAWDTSYAGDAPIAFYEVYHAEQRLGEVPHRPQTTREPFRFRIENAPPGEHSFRVRAVDQAGNTSDWAAVTLRCL